MRWDETNARRHSKWSDVSFLHTYIRCYGFLLIPYDTYSTLTLISSCVVLDCPNEHEASIHRTVWWEREPCKPYSTERATVMPISDIIIHILLISANYSHRHNYDLPAYSIKLQYITVKHTGIPTVFNPIRSSLHSTKTRITQSVIIFGPALSDDSLPEPTNFHRKTIAAIVIITILLCTCTVLVGISFVVCSPLVSHDPE